MTLSNLQQEEAWIDGMNRLAECLENKKMHILTELYDLLTKEEAETWIMEAAYESNITKFKTEWYKGVFNCYIKASSINILHTVMLKKKDLNLQSIIINNKEYCVTLTQVDWPHGISILVTVLDNDEQYFCSKVLCSSSSSTDYERVSKLPGQDLLDEAWQQFSEHYPFEKLNEAIKSGIMVLLPWR